MKCQNTWNLIHFWTCLMSDFIPQSLSGHSAFLFDASSSSLQESRRFGWWGILLCDGMFKNDFLSQVPEQKVLVDITTCPKIFVGSPQDLMSLMNSLGGILHHHFILGHPNGCHWLQRVSLGHCPCQSVC